MDIATQFSQTNIPALSGRLMVTTMRAWSGWTIPLSRRKRRSKALWPEVSHARAIRAVEIARQQAYKETADPLFFQYQRGEVTEAEWLAAVQAVKDNHPYPEA
jgi:hypothetical protein